MKPKTFFNRHPNESISASVTRLYQQVQLLNTVQQQLMQKPINTGKSPVRKPKLYLVK